MLLTLDKVKEFPTIVEQSIEAIAAFVRVSHNIPEVSSIKKHLIDFNNAFKKYKPWVFNFCANICEQTLSSPYSITPLSEFRKIILTCESIQSCIQRDDFILLLFEVEFITSQIESLSNSLNIEFFHAVSVDNTDNRMLHIYHDMALKIKSDSEYNSETYGKILCRIQESIDELQRKPADNPFIAVVGPSFMGKTQLAFILALIQPIIYINFSEGLSQPIYSLFSQISSEISNILLSDFKTFNRNHIGPFGPDSDALNGIYKNNKYGILGCLMAIYEKCSSLNFNSENFNWMQFYTELGSFPYINLSISEFIEKKSKPTVIF